MSREDALEWYDPGNQESTHLPWISSADAKEALNTV